MASIKGSKTEQNLLKAFAGESQARNRYNLFAGQARREGFIQIAAIFDKTAEQERQHAKRYFNFLEGGDVEITATFPAGKVESTEKNLAAAAAGEHMEWDELYPSFADVADEEGFPEAARAFRSISRAEKHHEERYLALQELVRSKQIFERDGEVYWCCSKCGYVHKGETPPKTCPSCLHPMEYFEILSEKF